jgi:adenylate cyclase
MTEAEIAGIATWTAQVGLEGRVETALVEGFCRRAVAAGLLLARAIAIIDTLHPIRHAGAPSGGGKNCRRPPSPDCSP